MDDVNYSVIETLDTPDVINLLSNINYNLNLFMFLFQFLIGVAYVLFLCYVLYKLFNYFGSV